MFVSARAMICFLAATHGDAGVEGLMADSLEPLVLDLVTWCAVAPRRYDEVLDVWRTSCPRLMVWEEAVTRGLVETRGGSHGLGVHVTAKGRELVAAALARRVARPRPPSAAQRR